MRKEDFIGKVKFEDESQEECPVEIPEFYGGKNKLDVFAKRVEEDKEE